MLILSQAEINALLPMSEGIVLMRETLIDLARGKMHQPLRMIVRPPDAKGLLGLMPAYKGGDSPALAVKVIGVFPGNSALGRDSHQGGVLLLDGTTGDLLAVMNASAITAIRTAAVSGVATDVLARTDASHLAIIGAGIQARSHLEAMAAVRPLRRVRIASRTLARAAALAREVQSRYPFPVEPVETVRAALEDADLIVTATGSHEPVVKREWVRPGAHINAVGASLPASRELDSATVATSLFFVDRRESTLNESGDYLLALRDGAIGPDHIRAEIGEVLTGAHPGRAGRDEITVFKSLGLAVEDLAAAARLYETARQRKAGTWVDF